MHHTSRQGKFHSKLSSKGKDKSRLPEIDPFYGNSTKYGEGFGAKTYLAKEVSKLGKEKSQDGLISARNHFRAKEIDPYVNAHKILAHQQSELPTANQQYKKKLSIQAEKDLMTADTIRPDPQYESIPYQLKQPQIPGLDMWALNNNLKQVTISQDQFSQTRKLPFYKVKQDIKDEKERTSGQLNKTKTQDIRSMYKIYGGGDIKTIQSQREKSQGQLNYKKMVDPIRKVKFTQKEAKSYTTINTKGISPLGNTLYGTLPVRKHHSNLDTTYYKRESSHNSILDKTGRDQSTNREVNPYLQTFINGSHLKREGSNQNIVILEMGTFGTKDKKEENKGANPRRNRFEIAEKEKQSIEDIEDNDLLDREPSKSLNYPTVSNNQNDEETSSQASEGPSPQNLTSSLPLSLAQQAQQKKKHYEYIRTIERINKLLLKDSSNYIEHYHTFSSIPNSKIEFCVSSLNHPELCGNSVQYKSIFKGERVQEIDGFGFQQEKQRVKKEQGKGPAESLGKPLKQVSKNKIN